MLRHQDQMFEDDESVSLDRIKSTQETKQTAISYLSRIIREIADGDREVFEFHVDVNRPIPTYGGADGISFGQSTTTMITLVEE